LVFTFAGLIAQLILFVAGLLGFLLAPLFLSGQHPDAVSYTHLDVYKRQHDMFLTPWMLVQAILLALGKMCIRDSFDSESEGRHRFRD